MGMTSASLLRFMQASDATMEGLFPATIRIAGLNYQCTGVGGAAALEYADEGGQVPTGMRVFRLSKAIHPARMESGARIEWVSTPGSVTRLTVIDCPDRPHETSWVLRCLPTYR
jgi:hypothetical protein